MRGPVAIRDVATAAVHGDLAGGDRNTLEYGSPGPSAPSVLPQHISSSAAAAIPLMDMARAACCTLLVLVSPPSGIAAVTATVTMAPPGMAHA